MSWRPRQSLHIGCQSIDSGWTYLTWDYVGKAPAEAKAGEAVAKEHGFDPRIVLDTPRTATKKIVLDHLNAWSKVVDPIDLFLTYTGHGTTRSLGEAERRSRCEGDPGVDEFIVLNGGGLCDNALAATWGSLKPGSRVLFVANCCYGGGLATIPVALRSLFAPLKWLATPARFLDDKITNSFECGAAETTTFAASVILIASSPPNGSSRVGLMTALQGALSAKPRNYPEWIDAAQKNYADEIFTCPLGPEADVDAMWNAPPLA